MHITYKEKLVAYLAFLSGISISIVAIYYSVSGLVSIFSAAVIPIIIMGITLEVSKLIATIWLKQNWLIAPRAIKAYLLTSIVILMAITSMGIFGFLARAHSDQSIPTGDILSQVQLFDEKINTERENISVNRKALEQMDSQVDELLNRSTNDAGANKAAKLRKQQEQERKELHNSISQAQLTISKLQSERAPVAAQARKVEAETGPIKYIAELIYGDTVNENLLEKAVQWIIVLIVIIFDPLAVTLLLASQYSFQHFKKYDTIITEPTTELFNDVITPVEDISTEIVEDIIVEDIADEIVEEFEEIDITPMKKGVRIPKISSTSTKNLIKQAKRKFKQDNPDKTLHEFEIKKELGVIDTLPWENAKSDIK